jgi:hypothetical protein
MENQKPIVFVGSASESLRIADAISNNLREVAFVKPWTKGFKLSQYTLEDLVKTASTYDFAIFVLSGDDIRESRGVEALVPRDNVIFETGLFTGVLGRDRVFVVKQKDANVQLPSDLLGLTVGDYSTPPTNQIADWETALGYSTSRIRDVIEELKTKPHPGAAAVKDAAEYFDQLLIDRYGVSAQLSSTTIAISDLDGSATITRKLGGIKVSGTAVKIDQIPGKIAPSASGGKITKHPTLIRKIDFRKPIYVNHRIKKDDLSEFAIVIKGSLTQADPQLDIEYESSVTKSFLMTREEVEKTYHDQNFKYEYISLKTEMPTDKVRLDISFPDGYPVELYPGVFFGNESESLHDSELNRVGAGFTKTTCGASFEVNKPVVGFNYIIYWVSPSADELAHMTPNGSVRS